MRGAARVRFDRILKTYLIHGVAAIAVLAFAAAMRSTIRRTESDDTTLSSLVLAGGIAASSVSLVQAAFGLVLTNKLVNTTDVGAIQALLELDNETDTYKLLALAMLIAATSIATLKGTSALPDWTAWLGFPVAALLVLAGFNFVIEATVLSLVLEISLVGLLAWFGSIGALGFLASRETGRDRRRPMAA